MKEHHQRPIKDVRELQAVVATQDRLAGFDDQSVMDAFQNLHYEHLELEDAIMNPDISREELAGEIADNIIILAKICNLLGLDMGTILSGKIHRNYAKYIIPAQNGTKPPEAKAQWDKSQDNKYLKGV